MDDDGVTIEAGGQVAEAWHLFQVRRAMLTHWSVCFSFGVAAELRVPLVRDAAASLLFVEGLNILDDAIEEVMSSEDYARGRKLKNRLEMLHKAGRLVDGPLLPQLNARRNEIAHEIDKGADVAELGEAVAAIERQLLAWCLVEERPPYELTFKQSRSTREAKNPDVAFETDMILRVVSGETICAELTQTRQHFKRGRGR